MPLNNTPAEAMMAKIAESKHEFREAIKIAESSLKRDPNKTSVVAILITAHLALGELTDASFLADQFVDRMPGLESYGLRALVLTAQGQRR